MTSCDAPMQAFVGNPLHNSIRLYRLRAMFFPAIFLMVVISTAGISAGDDGVYLNNLIGEARRLNLSNQRYWDLLLHYRPVSDGRESTVDDPRFFLSKAGKTDPEGEIEATLTGFFATPVEEKEHVRCRFVARYAWLKEQLQIDESRLPKVVCSDFERTLSNINPRSVALIFPVAYLNSPASMFGHTFLRIDGGHDSTLLSTAINYAAITEERTGVSYAMKGIAGGFRGYYYSLPYYEKIREYSAIEHRDIWEYRLDLTEEETRRIVLHYWEMRDVYSEYYFFDENCSFAALYLLEIARPSLRLIEETNPFWVIPLSTIRSVVDTGIVTEVTYRPSRGTRIRKISETLSQEGRRLSHDLATGTTDSTALVGADLSVDDRVRALDLASEYIQYLAGRRRINSEEYLGRFQEVMRERGKIGQPSERGFEIARPIRPDEGHLPGRIGIGGGCRTDSCFAEVNLRPGYHDLLDNDAGYVADAQINLMQVTLRHDLDDRRLELHRLRILDIASLSPRDLFLNPLAWKTVVGVEQKIVPGGEERLVASFTIGAGFSVLIGPAIAYTLAETELNASRSFDDSAAFGAGGSAGILAPLTPAWKIHCSIRSINPLWGDPYRMFRGEVAQNFMISKSSSVSAIALTEKNGGNAKSEFRMLWNVYF
jgi:hypothetical protein